MTNPGDDRLDVLIVGAGPTGLTLAGVLQAFGASFRIVDRQADRAHESRALVMQPRTLEVLRGLGVTPELLRRGNDAVWLRLYAGRRTLRVRLFGLGMADTAFPFLLFLSQAETEAVLGDRLAAGGARIERNLELTGYRADGGGVVCDLRHRDGRTEQVAARWLAGCDGAASSVRRGAGIPFRGGAYPQTFALADLEIDGDLEPGSTHSFLGPDSVLFCFPLGRPASWRVLVLHSSLQGRGDAAAPSLAELQALAGQLTGGRLRLHDPVWLSYFRLQHRHAARYRAGPVFLAGDAAHVHSPAGGQGMNTGIQDAWNLGWKLALVARGQAAEELLDSYDAERRPVGRFVVRATDWAFSAATSANLVVRTARTRLLPRVLPLVLRSGRPAGAGFRIVSQLGIGYRRSPAVREGRPRLRRGPRAGDRLPDAPVTRDGRACWLGEVLAAPGIHLLLCGPAGGWDAGRLAALGERGRGLLAVHHLTREASPGALHDPDAVALTRLGVGRRGQSAHYLVRPDGHVGYRAAGTDLGGLEDWLDQWLSAVLPSA